VRILQFDSIGGASGDMILASLIDLGANPSLLRKQLETFPIGPFQIEIRPFAENAVHGTQVHVRIPAHNHDEHRTLEDIRRLVQTSGLSSRARDMSVKVFERLAEAEAAVHRVRTDQVQFHELGAVDCIVDICGACAALDLLQVDEVVVGALPQGYGVTESSHGMMPVPAPATIELLKGMPISQTEEPSELVTPTGAALLGTWKTRDAVPPGSRILKTGCGFGHRQLKSRPNLLRTFLLESPEPHPEDVCLVLECNIDDMAPELAGALVQKLLADNALDAFITPVQMKKQRPGILLTVLCRPCDRERLLDTIFTESTTFGVREHMTQRTVLDRRHVQVSTPYGTVRVKIGRWKGKDVTRAPEYEDCVKCAAAANVPVRAVYEAAVAAGANA
jgi:uncharacterized protein (TIGR00299 family) protein